MTNFDLVYNRFLDKVTDDMYLELTPEETQKDLQNILLNAIPKFEFPKQSLNYNGQLFDSDLTSEEINILAILMLEVWVQRQVTSIENTRMKYSGSDFKFTSQAAHLGKLLDLLAQTKQEAIHLQRLYKRRVIDEQGNVKSNWSIFGRTS